MSGSESTGHRIRQSLLRILAALSAIGFTVGVCTWIYLRPVGVRITDGRHDRGQNGIWIGHGWVGDDSWFDRQNRSQEKASFRSPEPLSTLANQLRAHGITDVFPHLCPASSEGELPAADPSQVERLIDALPGCRILPWVGGNTHKTARLTDPTWRSSFAASCVALIQRHPRLAGVHLNLEPCRSGHPGLLLLLEDLRQRLPKGKLISLAGYPPPTPLQPGLEVHWEKVYVRELSRRMDQIAFMMYDTGLTDAGTYQRLMRDWTLEVLAWSRPAKVLLGLPAYEDTWATYHRPDVEHLENALLGIHAGLSTLQPRPASYQGTAVYSDWQMTKAKWSTYREQFVRSVSAPH